MYSRSLREFRDRIGHVHSRFEFYVSVFANVILFVMAWGIAIHATLRYFFGNPFRFSMLTVTELYLLPAFVFGTAAYLQTQNGNIRVDIFRLRFPARAKHLANVVSRTGAFLVFTPMCYFTYQAGMRAFVRGDARPGVVPLPTAYTWFIISFGLLLLSIRLLRQLFVDLEVLLGRREPTEPGPSDPREDVR